MFMRVYRLEVSTDAMRKSAVINQVGYRVSQASTKASVRLLPSLPTCLHT